jgi:hypothetical protein
MDPDDPALDYCLTVQVLPGWPTTLGTWPNLLKFYKLIMEDEMRMYRIGLLIVLFLLCGMDFGHAVGPWRATPSSTRGW